MPEADIAASVLLIVGGCLVASLGDFSFDLKGWELTLQTTCSSLILCLAP